MANAFRIQNLKGVEVNGKSIKVPLFGFANSMKNRASALTMIGQFVVLVPNVSKYLHNNHVSLIFEYTTLSLKKESLVYTLPLGLNAKTNHPLPVIGSNGIYQSCFLSQGYVYMLGNFLFNYSDENYGIARGMVEELQPLPLFVEMKVSASTMGITVLTRWFFDLVVIQY